MLATELELELKRTDMRRNAFAVWEVPGSLRFAIYIYMLDLIWNLCLWRSRLLVIFRIKVCFWIGRRHINIENAEQCGISFFGSVTHDGEAKGDQKGKGQSDAFEKNKCVEEACIQKCRKQTKWSAQASCCQVCWPQPVPRRRSSVQNAWSKDEAA